MKTPETMTRAELVEYVKHPKGMIAVLQKMNRAFEAMVRDRNLTR
jgi:hypothetical protein